MMVTSTGVFTSVTCIDSTEKLDVPLMRLCKSEVVVHHALTATEHTHCASSQTWLGPPSVIMTPFVVTMPMASALTQASNPPTQVPITPMPCVHHPGCPCPTVSMISADEGDAVSTTLSKTFNEMLSITSPTPNHSCQFS